MSGNDENGAAVDGLSRRGYLASVGTLGAAGLAGCSDSGSESTATASPTPSRRTTEDATPTGTPTGQSVVSVGEGGYTTVLPSGEDAPPDRVYATEDLSAPFPTNEWWSNLLRAQYGAPMWAHPLVGTPTDAGLNLSYPTEWTFSNPPGHAHPDNVAEMDAATDLTLSTTGRSFLDAVCAGYGDWHVDVRWGAGDASTPTLDATLTQGSPFVFAEVAGADAELSFAGRPEVWADRGNVLGVTVDGHHYGVFAPDSASWDGVGTATLTSALAGEEYLAVCVLPAATTDALSRYESYAYNRITGTTVSWTYDEASRTVETTYAFETDARPKSQATGTVAALYPHQHKHTDAALTGDTFVCPRGTMETVTGTSFATTMDLPPVVPYLPAVDDVDTDRLAGYVDDVESESPLVRRGPEQPGDGTYWTGKNYERLVQLRPIADQVDDDDAVESFTTALREDVETWLDPEVSGDSASDDVFYYDETWGTLVGYNDSFGSGPELNDHHFHYGYYVKAAADLARTDPAWADADAWGGMVELLIRDFASPSHDDELFPFLRNFSPYAGHSWAAGNPAFDIGNNQESSSEAVNAYAAILQYGEYTGDETLRDLGAYLLTHETAAVDAYWYDVDDENHPDDWPYEYAAMVWGGGYKHDTWWTDDAEAIHGINVLPVGGHSLSLGRDAAAAETVYDELVAENDGDDFDYWPDILWQYRSFSDPADAVRLFEENPEFYSVEFAESRAHTYHWLTAMAAFGTVDASVTADTPLAAVFSDGNTRTYLAYNAADAETTVTFSDGTTLAVAPNDLGYTTAPAPDDAAAVRTRTTPHSDTDSVPDRANDDSTTDTI